MDSHILSCDGFEVVSPTQLNELVLFENDQCGSNSDESTVTTEDNDAVFSGDSPPSDAAQEWASPKLIRSFYFVKQHPCDDAEIRTKIDEADKEIYLYNVARIQISNALKARRAERSALFAQMECLKSERDGHITIFDEKKNELEPLQEAFGNRRSFGGGQLCCSEKELDDDLICSTNYRIEHESVSLSVEKHLLEGTQKKIIASTAIKPQIQDSLGHKGAIIDRVNSMAMNVDEMKDREAVTAKINCLSEKLRRIKMETESLDAELAGVLDQRDKAFERIKTMRRQRDLRNAAFFQSRSIMMRARELAASGNMKDLEELANAEVEKFMSLWNTDKAFRDDYEERVSTSLDERQMSKDGRIRNPEEDLLVALEALGPLDIRTKGVVRALDKWGREDSSSCSSQDGNVAIKKTRKAEGKTVTDSNRCSLEESDCMDFNIPRYQKLQMEEIERQMSKDRRLRNPEEDLQVALEALGPLDIRTKGMVRALDKWGREDSSSCSFQDGNVATKKNKKAEGKTVTDSNKSSSEESDCLDFDILRYQKPQMEEEIDEETLKEKKREEELEKARQAMERKRRLQEKAAAKAAIRAQKEEEKKLKEREKKAKKKAAASSSPWERDDTPEAVTEASEPEKAKSSALVKEKRSIFRKQRSFRCRHRGRGAEALPKAIIKRRKAYKLWVWAASSAASAFALFIFAFFYLRWEEIKGFSRGLF